MHFKITLNVLYSIANDNNKYYYYYIIVTKRKKERVRANGFPYGNTVYLKTKTKNTTL